MAGNRRRRAFLALVIVFMTVFLVIGVGREKPARPAPAAPQEAIMKLPEPRFSSETSLEESLLKRRSVRTYSTQPLTLAEVSQLLWAAQGKTDPAGLRTAPSAGALYPLEVYVVAGSVRDLAPGVYRYLTQGHRLERMRGGDVRAALAEAALGQDYVENAPIDVIFTAVYERVTGKYGDRGVRYVDMEAGHAAQNLCLQAVALGLGAVTIGAFYDEQVREVIGAPGEEQPLYVIPVGKVG